MLLEPTWNEKRGWIYGEQYCGIKNGKIITRGGTGWWNEECMFQPLTDPKLKLMAELYYKEKTAKDLSAMIKTLEVKIEKINYALSLI